MIEHWLEGSYSMGVDVATEEDACGVRIFIHHNRETYWVWRSVELELLDVLLVDNEIWRHFW